MKPSVCGGVSKQELVAVAAGRSVPDTTKRQGGHNQETRRSLSHVMAQWWMTTNFGSWAAEVEADTQEEQEEAEEEFAFVCAWHVCMCALQLVVTT
jgi:hypothetical protein